MAKLTFQAHFSNHIRESFRTPALGLQARGLARSLSATSNSVQCAPPSLFRLGRRLFHDPIFVFTCPIAYCRTAPWFLDRLVFRSPCSRFREILKPANAALIFQKGCRTFLPNTHNPRTPYLRSADSSRPSISTYCATSLPPFTTVDILSKLEDDARSADTTRAAAGIIGPRSEYHH